MKTALTSLTALLITGIATAQTTFDFTAGTLSGSGEGQRWSQTVDGITLTVIFNEDTDDNYINAGSPALANANGLYVGATESTATERASYREYGVSISFSQDVRLKGYRWGATDRNDFTGTYYMALACGNVSALMYHMTGGSEHPFELEAVVPANTPVLSFFSGNQNFGNNYRLASLTVEPESYDAPVIPIPEGNETGITRIQMIPSQITFDGVTLSNGDTINFALKNGALHAWGDGQVYHRQEELFPGLESGVLDFSAFLNPDRFLFAQTVEGPVWFDINGLGVRPRLRELPADFPTALDRWALGVDFLLGLKDGQVFVAGDPDGYLANIPAEVQSGGVSDVAATQAVALALKEGRVYAWSTSTDVTVHPIVNNIPPELTAGQTDAIIATRNYAAGLVNGRVYAWGQDGAISWINNDERLQSGVASFFPSTVGEHYCAVLNDGTLAASKAQTLYEVVEQLPTVVQQLGFTQIVPSYTRASALLPSGRMVIWGLPRFEPSAVHGFSGMTVPQEVNSILFPQTASRLSDGGAPDAGELSILTSGGLGIQWGSNTQYEVQTTTDMLGGQWEPLPTDANNRFYRIQETNE